MGETSTSDRNGRTVAGYAGFISYSHAADGKLAPALQRGLQQFAKPWYQLRALRVFRDEANLSANPHLWSSITEALDKSAHFILLASPEAAASRWVGLECEYWRQKNAPERMLVGLTDGELRWDDALGDFDWEATNALPPQLRGAFSQEPRFIDLRWAKTEDDLTLTHSAFRDAVAEFAAPLHGKPKDAIAGDDVREHRRTRRIARTAVMVLAALTVVATVAGIVALHERATAIVQRDTAVSRLDAALALSQLPVNPRAAVRTSLAGLRARRTPQALSALFASLQADHLRLRFPSYPGGEESLALDPSGRLLAIGTRTGVVHLFDLNSGRETVLASGLGQAGALPGGGPGSLAFGNSGGVLILGNDRSPGVVEGIDIANGHARYRRAVGGGQVVASPDGGRFLAYFPSSGRAELLATGSGAVLASAGAGAGARVIAAGFGADGTALLVEPRGIALLTPGGPVAPTFAGGLSPIEAAALSAGGRFVLLQRASGRVEAWSTVQRRLVGRPFGAPLQSSPIAISPTGTTIALGYENTTPGGGPGTVRTYATATGLATAAFPTAVTQQQLAFTPSGAYLAAVDSHDLRVWDLATGQQLEEQPSDAKALLIGPRGKFVITGDYGSQVDGYELVPGGPLIFGASEASANAITPDGGRVLLESGSNVALVAALSGRALGPPLLTDAFGAPLLSADGRYVAASTTGGDVAVISVATRRVTVLPGARTARVQFATGNDSLVLIGGESGGWRLWSTSRRAPVGPSIVPTAAGTAADQGYSLTVTTDAALSPDGSMLATELDSGPVQLWSTSTGKQLRPPLRQPPNPGALSFSPDGRRLLVDGASAYIYDTASGRRLGVLPEAGTGAAFSPSGVVVATIGTTPANASVLRLWRADDGAPLTAPQQDDALGSTLSFSGDGHFLAAGPTIWSVPDLILVRRLTGDLTPNPDVWFAAHANRLLAVGSLSGGARAVAIHSCDLCVSPSQAARRAAEPVGTVISGGI